MVGKSPKGEFAARTLKTKSKNARWKDRYYKRRMLHLDVKADPLEVLCRLEPSCLKRLEWNANSQTLPLENASEYNSLRTVSRLRLSYRAMVH